jgi:hypothetical protein
MLLLELCVSEDLCALLLKSLDYYSEKSEFEF